MKGEVISAIIGVILIVGLIGFLVAHIAEDAPKGTAFRDCIRIQEELWVKRGYYINRIKIHNTRRYYLARAKNDDGDMVVITCKDAGELETIEVN